MLTIALLFDIIEMMTTSTYDSELSIDVSLERVLDEFICSKTDINVILSFLEMHEDCAKHIIENCTAMPRLLCNNMTYLSDKECIESLLSILERHSHSSSLISLLSFARMHAPMNDESIKTIIDNAISRLRRKLEKTTDIWVHPYSRFQGSSAKEFDACIAERSYPDKDLAVSIPTIVEKIFSTFSVENSMSILERSLAFPRILQLDSIDRMDNNTFCRLFSGINYVISSKFNEINKSILVNSAKNLCLQFLASGHPDEEKAGFFKILVQCAKNDYSLHDFKSYEEAALTLMLSGNRIDDMVLASYVHNAATTAFIKTIAENSEVVEQFPYVKLALAEMFSL